LVKKPKMSVFQILKSSCEISTFKGVTIKVSFPSLIILMVMPFKNPYDVVVHDIKLHQHQVLFSCLFLHIGGHALISTQKSVVRTTICFAYRLRANKD